MNIIKTVTKFTKYHNIYYGIIYTGLNQTVSLLQLTILCGMDRKEDIRKHNLYKLTTILCMDGVMFVVANRTELLNH